MKIRKALIATGALLIALGMVAPAWASGPLVDNSTTATAVGVGVGIGGGANVSTRQHQDQDQRQHQGQFQDQNQKQQANNDGNHQKIEGTTFDRYAPSIAAPGLTAAGTGVCLGSFSMGLTGPMAGLMFGKTVVDKGCEKRSEAALLYNMGHQRAALRVLAGESIQDALAAEGMLPAPRKSAAAVIPAAAVTVEASQIFGDQTAAASTPSRVQGN